MPRKERRYKFEAPAAKSEMPTMLDGNKKKIAVVLIVAALAIIIMSAVGLWALSQKKNTAGIDIALPNATLQNASYNATITCYDDECFLNRALASLSVSACDQILNENMRTSCYEKLANNVLDACLKVPNMLLKNECLQTHAVKQNSISLCKNINNATAEKTCIETIAPCYYKSGSEQLICLATLNKDYKQCNRDASCIMNYIKTNPDINACKELSLATAQNTCVSVVMKQDICGDLATAPDRDGCRLNYFKATLDPQICAAITNDTVYSQECYTALSVTKTDPTYCNYLPSTDVRWNCLINYTVYVNDPKACDLVPDYLPKSYSNCWYAYATSNFEPKGCIHIANPTYKGSCYERIFYTNASSLTPAKCASVDTDDWKNRCYTTIGKRDLDLGACDYITADAEKKLCTSIVGSAIAKANTTTS